jgi:hypothetical protein
MVLVRCDECGAVYDQGAHEWLNVGRSLSDAQADALDDDATLEPSLHFCGWPCLSTYATARALVDS